MVLDPERSLKVEKTVIIADTIKHINHIRSENGRLQHDMHQLEVCNIFNDPPKLAVKGSKIVLLFRYCPKTLPGRLIVYS